MSANNGTLKAVGAAAAAVASLIAVAGAFGFLTPAGRAERVEKKAAAVQDKLDSHELRLTTVEARYDDLKDEVRSSAARVESKVDKLIDMELGKRRSR